MKVNLRSYLVPNGKIYFTLSSFYERVCVFINKEPTMFESNIISLRIWYEIKCKREYPSEYLLEDTSKFNFRKFMRHYLTSVMIRFPTFSLSEWNSWSLEQRPPTFCLAVVLSVFNSLAVIIMNLEGFLVIVVEWKNFFAHCRGHGPSFI